MSDEPSVKTVMAFPLAEYNKHGLLVYEHGMTLLDYFAGQFISRGDTVEDAFRNAALAMEERKKYL